MTYKVIEFAKNQGYKTAEYRAKWNGYDVYEPIYSDEFSYIGIPFWVLVRGDKIRLSSEKECFEILDIIGSEQEMFDNAFDKVVKKKVNTNDEIKQSVLEKIRKLFKK